MFGKYTVPSVYLFVVASGEEIVNVRKLRLVCWVETS